MAEFNESEHPRKDDGKFAEKAKAQSKYESEMADIERQTRKWTADSKNERKRKKVRLSKQEYAVADKARKEKFAEYRRKGRVPRRDYVYTDGKLIVFNNRGRDAFVVTKVIPLDEKQYIIDLYVREIDDENND